MGGGQPRDARRSDRTCHPGLGGTAVSQGTHPEPAMRAEGLAPGLGRQILEHAPSGGRPPGCRPSIPRPRSAPGATARHERGVTYAPARQQPPRPGGILGDTTTVKGVGRPLIVTAAVSQRHAINPRWRILTSSQQSWDEAPNLSRQIVLEPTSQSKHQPMDVAVWLQASVLRRNSAAAELRTAATAQPRQLRRSARRRLECAPPGWGRSARSRYSRPRTGSAPTVAADTLAG
jgi:hypothetical protein